MTDNRSDNDIVQSMIDAMSADEVRKWLEDELRNCCRIAKTKTGDDRMGWLRDVAYFAATVGLVDWTGHAND